MAKLLKASLHFEAVDMVTPSVPEEAFHFVADMVWSNISEEGLVHIEKGLLMGLASLGDQA